VDINAESELYQLELKMKKEAEVQKMNLLQCETEKENTKHQLEL